MYFSHLPATDELATGFQPRICDLGVVLDGFAVRVSGRIDRVNLNDIGQSKSFGAGPFSAEAQRELVLFLCKLSLILAVDRNSVLLTGAKPG